VKILADLPELSAVQAPLRIGTLVEQAAVPFGDMSAFAGPLWAFMSDRLQYLLEQRGFDIRNVRAVTHGPVAETSPLEARRKLEALAQMSGLDSLIGVARLFKRVKNITKGVLGTDDLASLDSKLTEPAERDLWSALSRAGGTIREAVVSGRYRDACTEIASLEPAVSTFFDKVLVMAEDRDVRANRLALVATLRDRILELADISEIVSEPE
jgi:glycyl-tRNA synthetase beta chain